MPGSHSATYWLQVEAVPSVARLVPFPEVVVGRCRATPRRPWKREPGWCWGSRVEPGASALGLPGWGPGEDALEGQVGWRGTEGSGRIEAHSCATQRDVHECGRELKEEVRMERAWSVRLYPKSEWRKGLGWSPGGAVKAGPGPRVSAGGGSSLFVLVTVKCVRPAF